MKFLIIGCGSIGQRHLKTLLNMGHQVVGYNRSNSRVDTLKNKFDVKIYYDLDEMLDHETADAAFVCTPNSLHMEHSIKAAKYGLNLFIEKPLSHSTEGLETLSQVVNEKAMLVHVGSNMRFNYGPKMIYEELKSGRIGQPLWAHFWGGMHLPSWHPDEDYHEMYSSKINLGGGATLDFIHELDLILWMFGKPDIVTALTANSGWLEIETEEIVDAVLKYSYGLQVNLHLDYLQKPFQRGIRIVGSKGWINWDLNRELIELHSYVLDKTDIYPHPKTWTHQKMYESQMRYFIDCLQKKKESMSNLVSGADSLELALDIKKSSQQMIFVKGDI